MRLNCCTLICADWVQGWTVRCCQQVSSSTCLGRSQEGGAAGPEAGQLCTCAGHSAGAQICSQACHHTCRLCVQDPAGLCCGFCSSCCCHGQAQARRAATQQEPLVGHALAQCTPCNPLACFVCQCLSTLPLSRHTRDGLDLTEQSTCAADVAAADGAAGGLAAVGKFCAHAHSLGRAVLPQGAQLLSFRGV